MSLLPIFSNSPDRNCLLVGAGNVALDKIGSLLPTGLNLRVVAPDALPEIRQLAAKANSNGSSAASKSDLDGNFLVIAATDAP
jgi:siroheme synthase-like protein